MNSSIQAARTLWSICFPDDDADFLDFYFSKVARAEDTYLEYNQDGLAVAHIGIIRSEYFPRIKQPKRIKLAYISGACVHPDYRGQGLMHKLMQSVEEEERKRGTDALILIPANEKLRAYYGENFGFADAGFRYQIPASELENLQLEMLWMSADKDYELLCEYGGVYPTPSYSSEHAELIVQEYRRIASCQVLTEQRGEAFDAILLAREEAEQWVIDRLTGYEDATARLVRQLRKLKDKPIIISNLVRANLREEALLCPRLKREPWGMYKCLNTEIKPEYMQELLVCHFFE